MYKGRSDLHTTQAQFASLAFGVQSSTALPEMLLKQFQIRVEAYHLAAKDDMPFCKSTFGYESIETMKLALSQHNVAVVDKQLDIILAHIHPSDRDLRVWVAAQLHYWQNVLLQSEGGRRLVSFASAMMQAEWQEFERWRGI
jgi:hypothetical protein